jgi:hypothetical protein
MRNIWIILEGWKILQRQRRFFTVDPSIGEDQQDISTGYRDSTVEQKTISGYIRNFKQF